MSGTHPFIAPSYRGKHLTAIEQKRRAQNMGYNQLAEKAGLERHLVVKALVGGPTSTDFATLVALAAAVGHDLSAPLTQGQLATAAS